MKKKCNFSSLGIISYNINLLYQEVPDLLGSISDQKVNDYLSSCRSCFDAIVMRAVPVEANELSKIISLSKIILRPGGAFLGSVSDSMTPDELGIVINKYVSDEKILEDSFQREQVVKSDMFFDIRKVKPKDISLKTNKLFNSIYEYFSIVIPNLKQAE